MAALKFTFTKSLRPVVVLLTGPTVLGLLTAVAFVVTVPELRGPRGILFAFGARLVVALTIFAPIAGALAFRAPLCRWLARRGFAVQWYTSVLIAFALGYLVASMRQDSSNMNELLNRDLRRSVASAVHLV